MHHPGQSKSTIGIWTNMVGKLRCITFGILTEMFQGSNWNPLLHQFDTGDSMKDSQYDPNGPAHSTSAPRIFAVYSPTAEDLAKASLLPADACPRRYCWWWRSLSFDWNVIPAEGCTFLHAGKVAGWKNSDVACCRSDRQSVTDHFEPREPHLLEDGIDPARWLRFRCENRAKK
jgi:hypothetical protein